MITVMLVALAAVNAIFITWATALDARHSLALARALGATPREVSAGLSAAQVLPALAGAVLGIPGGIGLYMAVVPDEAPIPPLSWLLAVVAGTVLVVAVLTTIPSPPRRTAPRCPDPASRTCLMPKEPNVDPVTPFVGVTTASGQTGRYLVREFARRGMRGGAWCAARAADAAREAGASRRRRPTSPTGIHGGRARGLDLLVFIAPPFDGREDAHAADALAVAGGQGVGHFVYYSVLHPSFRGVPHHRRKLDVETQVKDSDLRWTIIQPTMYQQTFLGLVRQATDGVLRLPYSPAARFHLVDLQDGVPTARSATKPASLSTFSACETRDG